MLLLSSRMVALSKVRWRIISKKHSTPLEHVSMQSCCLISYSRFMGSQYVFRHCYRSRPRHEHAHEECEVHCQGQKPRVFGAPLRSWQHGVFLPIDVFVSLTFIRHMLLFIRHAGLTCFQGPLLHSSGHAQVRLSLAFLPLWTMYASKLPTPLSHTLQLGHAPCR